MVELFVIKVKSVKSGKGGYMTRQTRKGEDGIIIEFIPDIIDNDKAVDVLNVIGYYTRGSAEQTAQLIIDKAEERYPNAILEVDVVTHNITLAESQQFSQMSWSYK